MVQFHLDVIKTPSGFCKICEIALTIIILSICEGIADFQYGNENKTFFCGGVFIMSITVTTMIFFVYLRGYSQELHKTSLEVRFNATMTCLMIAAGSIIVHAYCTSLKHTTFADAGKTAGSFGIINGIFYMVDTVLAYQSMVVAVMTGE